MQDPKLAPQAAKKGKRVRQIKDVGARLESFVDRVDLIVSESVEEREDDMSNLATRFVMQRPIQDASAQGEPTLDSEVPSGKHQKRSGPNEEAQKSPTVITIDSPEQAPNVFQALEGAT